MQTLSIEEAQSRLPEIIAALPVRQEFTITCDGKTIAQLAVIPASAETKRERPRSILDLPTFPGRVLKPEFDRSEVWDEIYRGEE